MKGQYAYPTKGIIISNIFTFVMIALTSMIKPDAGVLVFTEFVILPFIMGIICAWYWKHLELSGKELVTLSCLTGFLAIILSAVFLGEGVICLLIVSPLIFAFIISGVFTGKAMFKKNNGKLNTSILSLLLIFAVVDSISEHHYENLVSDELLIKAKPEEVWKHIVAFERIEKENEFWLFRLGMPSPIAATVEGHFEGAGRKCIFSNGYVFDEKITTYQQNKDLTFEITHQPQDPEIMGHIDILKGQFILKDNKDGTTTLVGNSWYRLHVFPIWYYDLWAESITRNVHLRVMDHVKHLSEN